MENVDFMIGPVISRSEIVPEKSRMLEDDCNKVLYENIVMRCFFLPGKELDVNSDGEICLMCEILNKNHVLSSYASSILCIVSHVIFVWYYEYIQKPKIK